MAGTFTDQAALAANSDFVNKCRAAMIFRATELTNSAAAQNFRTLTQMNAILQSAGAAAANIAWLVATGNSTIAAAAPAVPNDGDTQFAVNTTLAAIQT